MTRFYLLVMLAIVFIELARPAAAADNAATEAYELRMKGRVDQARRHCWRRPLRKMPDNAAAYYELARTHMHMALGNPQNLEQSFADAQKSIDQGRRS